MFRPDTVPPLDASGRLGQGLRLEGICPPRSTACQAPAPTRPSAGSRRQARWWFWSSRSSARISAPPPAPWRISACRGCGWSRQRQRWPNDKARMMAAGADRVLDGAELYDTPRSRDRRLQLCSGHDRARPRPGQARRRAGRSGGTMAPRVAAGETVAHPVRPRAQRARKRRGGARRLHRHVAGQSGLCLA